MSDLRTAVREATARGVARRGRHRLARGRRRGARRARARHRRRARCGGRWSCGGPTPATGTPASSPSARPGCRCSTSPDVAHFRRLDLAVGPGVFVPRPETEVVAGLAIDAARAAGGRRRSSSTCAPAPAPSRSPSRTRCPAPGCCAVELSDLAHGWAVANRDRLGLDVDVRLGDATTAFDDLEGEVDVVVSNPPYIPVGAVPVDPEVRDHDPRGRALRRVGRRARGPARGGRAGGRAAAAGRGARHGARRQPGRLRCRARCARPGGGRRSSTTPTSPAGRARRWRCGDRGLGRPRGGDVGRTRVRPARRPRVARRGQSRGRG